MSDDHNPSPDPRSGTDERDYFLKRAEDHRRLAEKSAEAGAKSIHVRLEKLYKTKATLMVMVHPD